MKAKAVRLLILAALCTAALWSPAASRADIDYCPPGFGCAHWESVCTSNGGTFNAAYIGPCQVDEGVYSNLWSVECTYTWRGPWSLQCAS